MPTGWIRAYDEEIAEFGFSDSDYRIRNARAEFRRDFTTNLHASASGNSAVLGKLQWGDEVELPSGLARTAWTRVIADGEIAFVRTAHLVEVAYIRRDPDADNKNTAPLTFTSRGELHTVKLLWGDCVQIIDRGDDVCRVRARGFTGEVATGRLCPDGLMVVYFIDVGQGDGVLVQTPDGRHLLVDGGLERTKQHTGKNAADFVDWKFFKDYGDFRVRLDGLMASHSDNDHYGGLHDLVRHNIEREHFLADRELDCLGVDIDTFYHPGLSRWKNRSDAAIAHHDGLGPRETDTDFNWFVRLLTDRADAESAMDNNADNALSGPWKWFVRDILLNDKNTQVERVGFDRAALQTGAPLPDLWKADDYAIKILGPISVDRNGKPSLPDLGPKSYNTNGHSICLRLDIGNASIMLTGDLNKDSMDWLSGCYGDRMGAWLCDVAKACHHGSHKISYRFLEMMRPAATVISSGDNEGHAHPRPEIVGASAISGRVEIDRDNDKLLTPLIYSTEIERSVSLGAIHRFDYEGVVTENDAVTHWGSIIGRHFDASNDKALVSPSEQSEIDALPTAKQSKHRKDIRAENRALFRSQEQAVLKGDMRLKAGITVPQGPLGAEFKWRSLWRARIMERNHYGLVNVRTDGNTIMCATMDETAEDWIVHTFPARTGH